MAEEIKQSIVRFCNKNRNYIGAGTLVSQKHVLTCAHVIADALGIPRTVQEKPAEKVGLDFPFIASGQILKAKVIFWLPVQLHQSEFLPEDIALLELDELAPKRARVSKFGAITIERSEIIGGEWGSNTSLHEWTESHIPTASDLEGHLFEVCGFPSGGAHGVWAKGILTKETANGWIQIEAIGQEGYQIEPGFSGAPVWGKELQGIVGLTVATDPRRPQVRVGFIIPTQVLYEACPKLHGIDLETRNEVLSKITEQYKKLFSEILPHELPFKVNDDAQAVLQPLRNEIDELLKQGDSKYSTSVESIEKSVISQRFKKYSDVEVDYRKLSNLLQANQWENADDETFRLIFEIILRLQKSLHDYRYAIEDRLRSGKLFSSEEFGRIPCKDLLTIDQLWTEHSQGKFGFSTQRKLWEETEQGGVPIDERFCRFGEQVGWYKSQTNQKRVIKLSKEIKRFLIFKLHEKKEVFLEQEEIVPAKWLSYQEIVSTQSLLPGCFPLKASVGVGIDLGGAWKQEIIPIGFDTGWYGGEVSFEKKQLIATGELGSSYLRDIFMRLSACAHKIC